MSPPRPKPSEIATEAKRMYIPLVESQTPELCTGSILYPDSAYLPVTPEKRSNARPCIAVIPNDPVDVAVGWHAERSGEGGELGPVPVVNMANEKRPGGDWESGLMAPEECFARRSNLVRALVTPAAGQAGGGAGGHYPIPQRGGLYSPSVVVFRDGPDHYELWQTSRWLPVISVAPVRRPKLTTSSSSSSSSRPSSPTYSFAAERTLQKEKMRTILRIAAHCGHRELCLGAFGVGPVFRNPAREVARMWRELLFDEEEFRGVFSNVVFAVERNGGGAAGEGRSGNGGGRSGGGGGRVAAQVVDDYEIFREELDPGMIFRTSYR
ncbi:hypothetical protein K402DRAFT_151377 [Aulographum hederae CBS 113979]|uniref:Microbial-type PARG catalytic domain-containing protein n=1 Tax=Aulographum hederae CBS 113979 TaxID=1176131 RepID=A0A6G1GTL5_9PEZI|nr:hypothetical protein K402DRAFT_151377 [Aulographum hederae CBS 113979]